MTLDEYEEDLTSEGVDLPGESVVDTDSSVFDFDFDEDEDEDDAELTGWQGGDPIPMVVDESADAVFGDQSVGEDNGGSKPPKKGTALQVRSSFLLLTFFYSLRLTDAYADHL